MLRVTVTLVPKGNEREAVDLAEIEVVNAIQDVDLSTYSVRAIRDGIGLTLPAEILHDPDRGLQDLLRRVFTVPT